MNSDTDLNELVLFTKQLNVLYVEDNQEAQTSMMGLLNNFFINITIANDGVEGLQAFEEEQFDIVLTDIHMPNMNGIDMIVNIRALDATIFIVVLSAYDTFEKTLNFNDISTNYSLKKPINIADFIAVMQELYKSRHTMRSFK
jgi:YesN/AraC family two-component response regulator